MKRVEENIISSENRALATLLQLPGMVALKKINRRVFLRAALGGIGALMTAPLWSRSEARAETEAPRQGSLTMNGKEYPLFLEISDDKGRPLVPKKQGFVYWGPSLFGNRAILYAEWFQSGRDLLDLKSPQADPKLRLVLNQTTSPVVKEATLSQLFTLPVFGKVGEEPIKAFINPQEWLEAYEVAVKDGSPQRHSDGSLVLGRPVLALSLGDLQKAENITQSSPDALFGMTCLNGSSRPVAVLQATPAGVDTKQIYTMLHYPEQYLMARFDPVPSQSPNI